MRLDHLLSKDFFARDAWVGLFVGLLVFVLFLVFGTRKKCVACRLLSSCCVVGVVCVLWLGVLLGIRTLACLFTACEQLVRVCPCFLFVVLVWWLVVA